MSDMTAKVAHSADQTAIEVNGFEELKYGFKFIDNIFDPKHQDLAGIYKKWGRCLVVTDDKINKMYGEQLKAYFAAHDIALTVHTFPGGEMYKTMDTMLQFVDAFADFGLIRKEPVLAIGGGLVTDVCGFACASYRRNTNFIRIPTTVIGLIDAAVSIKVGINHGKLKNRLGAYHAPIMTFLDFTFLKSLPVGQVRNGFAELIKISSVSDIRTWELLEKNGEALIETHFGRADGAKDDILDIAKEICQRGIKVMLDLESPNLHEIGLDRVIAFGHTWSPTLELKPEIPLRHGHAISIDMAYSTTLAWTRGYITEAERDEILGLFSRVGLSMDHELFDEDLLKAGTEAILQTRDGKQRFVVPKPIGTPYFINDAPMEELYSALKTHKEVCQKFPRHGAGVEAYVDAGDLGQDPEQLLREKHQENGVNAGVDESHVGPENSKTAATNGTGASLKNKGTAARAQHAECGC